MIRMINGCYLSEKVECLVPLCHVRIRRNLVRVRVGVRVRVRVRVTVGDPVLVV